MAWLELHQSLRNHPKLIRLAKAVGATDRDLVRAKLENLWLWVLDYREDGSLVGLSPEEIAEASGWTGNAHQWHEALMHAEFVDRDTQSVHDWDSYAGRLVDRRAANRDRVKRWRAKRNKQARKGQSVTRTKRARNGATEPDLTEPDLTGVDPPPPPAPDGAPAAKGPARRAAAKPSPPPTESAGDPSVTSAGDVERVVAAYVEAFIATHRPEPHITERDREAIRGMLRVGRTVAELSGALVRYVTLDGGWEELHGHPLRGLPGSWNRLFPRPAVHRVEPPSPPSPPPELSAEILAALEAPFDLGGVEVWRRVTAELQPAIKPRAWRTWFEPARYVGSSGGVHWVAVEYSHTADHIHAFYGLALAKAQERAELAEGELVRLVGGAEVYARALELEGVKR